MSAPHQRQQRDPSQNEFSPRHRRNRSSGRRVLSLCHHQAQRYQWFVVALGVYLVASYVQLLLAATHGSCCSFHDSNADTIVPHQVPQEEPFPLASSLDPLRTNFPLYTSSGQIRYQEQQAKQAIVPAGPQLRPVYSFPPPRTIIDELCTSCRTVSISPTLTCGEWMRLQKEDNWTSVGQRAASTFDACTRCSCSSLTDRTYWPPDDAAPHILAGRTPRLTLPRRYRLPVVGNLDAFFVAPADGNSSSTEHRHPYLFEWNPSIIVLPADQIPHRHSGNSPTDRPVYLASFRVSKQQNCFRRNRSFYKYIGSEHEGFRQDFGVDLVGLALLRSDYSILEQGVFDLRHVLQRDQDLRLFTFPADSSGGDDNTRGSRMYLSAFHQVSRLWLRPPPATDPTSTTTSSKKRIFFDYFSRTNNSFVVILDDEPSCCTACQGGKNFNYFLDEPSSRIMVETLPFGPHTVEEMNFGADCATSARANAFRSTTINDPFVPKPSFANTDELYFASRGIDRLPYSAEHGTACCVRIDDPRYNHSADDGNTTFLLVGVSHSKTVLEGRIKQKLRDAGVVAEPRQYLSRFYAFEPRMPYRVVALSGGFCLPFPLEEEASENLHNLIVQERPYQLGEDLNCPYITFVSGISPHATDPNRVILAYGMNDCAARIVEVAKSDILHMLFDPLKRLNGTTYPPTMNEK